MSTDNYTREYKYQKGIDYEQLLLQQMSRIAQYRSQKKLELYEESIDTFILMLPLELQDKALSYKKEEEITFGISKKQKQSYDDLWRFCNKLLSQANLIYRTSYIKTYE
jgi:hypothetical protein